MIRKRCRKVKHFFAEFCNKKRPRFRAVSCVADHQPLPTPDDYLRAFAGAVCPGLLSALGSTGRPKRIAFLPSDLSPRMSLIAVSGTPPSFRVLRAPATASMTLPASMSVLKEITLPSFRHLPLTRK